MANNNNIFDWRRYKSEYKDLQHLGTALSVCNHFIKFGIKERRYAYVYIPSNDTTSTKLNVHYSHNFDWKTYKQYEIHQGNYNARIWSEVHAFTHWCEKMYHILKNNKSDVTPLFNSSDSLNTSTNNHVRTPKCDIISVINTMENNAEVHLFPEPNLFNELTDKYDNIDTFMSSIASYKNILFVSGDVPGYGGSATLCHYLQKFIQSYKHNTHSIYFKYDTQTFGQSFEQLNEPNISSSTFTSVNMYTAINKIFDFKPDLIIFKSPLQIPFNKLPNCHKIFIIGGIYTNKMNTYYTNLKTIEEHKYFINPDVINTVQNCHVSYTSCNHTHDILKQCYGIEAPVMYSTFIPFYKKSIPDVSNTFDNRPYDYGLIVSDFTRPIKNIAKSIEFLKNKQRVILIGKNSNIYSNYGDNFKCIELLNHNDLKSYYRMIKYIRQDSFYESCSNVMVEAVFHGCKISSELSQMTVSLFDDHLIDVPNTVSIGQKLIYSLSTTVPYIIPIDYKDIDKYILFKKNTRYIVGNIHTFYDINMDKLFNVDNTTIRSDNIIIKYLVDTPNISEIAIAVQVKETSIMNMRELLKVSSFSSTIIGMSPYYYELDDEWTDDSCHGLIVKIYYLYGSVGVSLNSLGLNLFYNEYIKWLPNILSKTQLERTFNRKIFILCCAYYYGTQLDNQYLQKVWYALNNVPLHSKKALLLSKKILGYGGVQKTSQQIIEILDCEYDVVVLSQSRPGENNSSHTVPTIFLSKSSYNFEYNRINQDIPNCIIVQHSTREHIEKYINNTPFDCIINNKLNEALSWNLNKKIICLCHNSMDPFNTIICKNQNKIQAVLTINKFHANLLRYNKLEPNIYLYNNYAYEKKPNMITSKCEFSYKIAFVGRLSNEKNVQCLIDGVNLFNQSTSQKITLLIVGTGTCEYTNLTDQTIMLGYYDKQKLNELYAQVDYVISASVTEGKPFSVIEAQSIGIPCIHSNINGIGEIIFDGINGFTFDFAGDIYESIKTDMNFDNLGKLFDENNKYNVANVLTRAYSITISEWNKMSLETYNHCESTYEKQTCTFKNLKTVQSIISDDSNDTNVHPDGGDYKLVTNKKRIFINFKPNPSVAYGGGNISVHYIMTRLNSNVSEFNVVYDLCEDIDVYIIVDPFKSRDGFKKYSLEDVVKYRNSQQLNNRGKIVIRVNDCDITRPTASASSGRSRETEIIKYFSEINYFIFNSQFIKEYYVSKLKKLNMNISNNNNTVIINGCCPNTFQAYSRNDICMDNINSENKLKIVTHHWSNNPNKGYQTYYNLWKYTQDNPDSNIEFVFIGKSAPDEFSKLPIIGPLVPSQINKELNSCHMYLTDSRYDSCPNHVLEAISCGLPVLYSNAPGGAKELCTMTSYTIGEMFEPQSSSVENLIKKINKIKQNYSFYTNNVIKARETFHSERCTSQYYTTLLQLTKATSNYANKLKISVPYTNNIITVTVKNTDDLFIQINGTSTKLLRGINVFSLNISSETRENVCVFIYGDILTHIKNIHTTVRDFDDRRANTTNSHETNLLSNGEQPNIVLCSDQNYLVGMFAVLHSVVINSQYTDKARFNFIVPFKCCYSRFPSMILEFKRKMNIEMDTAIIYITPEILNPILFQSKCYNGGGHLLNLGNLSRMLLGEFTEYKKVMYLDSDSIVQYDIIEKLLMFDVEAPMYAGKADRVCSNNKKQIIIKMSSILDCTRDWSDLIHGVTTIDNDEYVFMGAPFIANCTLWKNVYPDIIRIINVHNHTEGGIYKLFTMSLQNIVFYDKIKNINEIISTLQDLGSMRKSWDHKEIVGTDVLDWSGMYKPWFKNGLYRHLWISHDIMNLSFMYGEVDGNKHNKKIEQFSTNQSIDKIGEVYTFTHIRADHFDKSVPHNILIEFDKYLNSFTQAKHSDSLIHIAYVCDAKYWMVKMSRVRFWVIEELGNRDNICLTLTGPGFLNYSNDITLQMNVIRLGLPFQLVMWYKPLDTHYNFDPVFETTYGSAFPFKTCLRYNEMWDNEWTNKEINNSKTDIIICHHHNDYKLYLTAAEKSNVISPQFFYIPHCANPSIFKPCPNTTKDIDILISGVTKQKHYPFKHRLNKILLNDKRFKKFNVHVYTHPGYSGFTNFKSVAQNDYNKIINRSKVCIACTSKYKYRLGKYVEIPMAGGIIVGDEPEYDGQDKFNEFIVPIHDGMSNNKITDIITRVVQNFDKDNMIINKRNIGMNWAKNYTPKTYVDTFIKTVFPNKHKIFIISDEIRKDHPEFRNEKWICDVLKEEFYKAFPESTTLNPMKANIIWYLAPWNLRYTPPRVKRETWLSYLSSPSVTVIFTQHHIDPCKLKIGQLTNQFSFMNTYGSHFHAICSNTMKDMQPYFPVEKTSCKFLWINDNNYFPIIDKSKLRENFGFNSSDYLIGSFQKDTEGQTNMPKLSKGPDIFVNIIKDMFKTNPNICVVLTGLRREYIINELTKSGINYKYFNMVSLDIINQLYNCLDLYLVASRCEGGPRAIVECGLTNTPIISTRVGISTELMDERLLFDVENWETYKNAMYFKNSTGPLRNKVLKLSSDKYMNEFHQYIENTNNYNN